MGLPSDIDLDRVWLVSDTHFGHENIKAYCHRPQDVEQIMMEEWARAVPNDHVVIHLGDLSWKSNAFFKNMIAPHLTGEKYLILGNHDKGRFSFYRQSGFKIIRPFAITYIQPCLDCHGEGVHAEPSLPLEVPCGGPGPNLWTVSLSHYPWDDSTDGPIPEQHIRIHGHIHNNGYNDRDEPFLPYKRNHINLSAEMVKYRPVHLMTLLHGVLNSA